MPDTSYLRKMGRLSQSSCHRIGVHLVPFLLRKLKTSAGVRRFLAAKAQSLLRQLMILVTAQKWSLLPGVKKKVVLKDLSEKNAKYQGQVHLRFWHVVSSHMVNKLDSHGWSIAARLRVADNHQADIFLAQGFRTPTIKLLPDQQVLQLAFGIRECLRRVFQR